ncbi:hypothetical protein [Streptomyces klenkii]|uniref:hypothetical protein n=1 Tax=Streptomyces klenkii TaxID=1420899 RepID=UPI0034264C25
MESPVTFERLLLGAQHFARLAMDAHAQEEMEVFLLEAGVSVERLAKAALVHVHPTLLTEMSGKDDVLLHLAGAIPMPDKLRTIGAMPALTRLRKMDVLPKSGELDTLIELRNGVAHLGTSSPEDYLGPFAETICRLLDHLGQDREAFWGPWSGVVRVALDDRIDRAQRRVRLRMERAARRAESRFTDMPEGTVENLAKLLAQRGLIVVEVGSSGVLFQGLARCPACSAEAAALFLKASSESMLFEMDLAAEGLLCQICGLHLVSGEEVAIAGLPTAVRYQAEDLAKLAGDDRPHPFYTPRSIGLYVSAAIAKPGDSF